MPTIKFPKNPNTDTAFVEQDDGTKNRALMIAPQDISTLELPNNPNSTKGYITVDGKKQRVILTADITGGGGGGSGLPDQTGHSGEFLTTDGTDASWSDKPLVNNVNGIYSIALASGATASNNGSAIGYNCNGVGGFAAGSSSRSTNGAGVGSSAIATGQGAVAVGRLVTASGASSIQLGDGNMLGGATNSDANTFKVANANGNFEIMSADGTIPTARFTTDPVSDGTYVPTLTITSGVATRSWSAPSGGLPSQTGNAGKFLTTDGTDASWAAVGALPDQTGNAGKFLTTDGTDASWSNELSNEFNIVAPVSVRHWLGIKATNAPSGCYFRLSGSDIGNKYAETTLYVGYPTTYGPYGGQSYFRFEYNYTNLSARVARFYAYGTGVDKTELGGPSDKWGAVYTTKINNGADITVPATSGTMVVATPPSADGTYVLKATVSSGVVTVAWVAE